VTSGAHLGAGIISAYILESFVFNRPVTPATLSLAIGLSMLPDLDALWVRARQQRRGTHGHNNHHTLPSHTPIFYLVIALAAAIGLSWQASVLFTVITLGHLVLDSWATDDGIMWLYPFRRKQYALLARPIHKGGLYGKAFYKQYYQHWHFVVAESALLVGGLIVTGLTVMPCFV